MPSLSEYLQAAALTALAGTGTFAQESREQATLTANGSALPLVVLADFSTSQAATTARVTRAQVALFFGTSKPGQGDDAEAEAQAVSQMDALSRHFLAALDANALVEITAVQAVAVHNTYEAELTGIGLRFTLGAPATTLVAACLPPPADAEASIVPGISNAALLLALQRAGALRPAPELNAE